MDIGRRFKIYRERSGLSQKDAAKALGVKPYQLANYETNRSEPNIATLKKMSKLYHVSLDTLLGNSKLSERTEQNAPIDEKEYDYASIKQKVEDLLREIEKRQGDK